jgi:alpha-tubulin suppressor-like RCC1 family protein
MLKLVFGTFAVMALAAVSGGSQSVDAGTPPAVGATFVEVGFKHVCAVTGDGGAQCWGDNGGGQLGDGTEEGRRTPVWVMGLDERVDVVSAADAHSCALGEEGAVSCWGYNGDGELGDGTGMDSPTPVAVAGLDEGVTDVASGELHTCAVLDSGGIRCWGFNVVGQLGDGTTDDALAPVSVVGLSNGVQVDGGEDDFTCAVTTGSAAYCWGNNDEGHLGDGTTQTRSTPVQVSGLGSGVDTVSAGGSHACALMAAGTVRCWGRGYEGQLGNSMNPGSLVPVEVANLDNIVEISAGAFHTCALDAGGYVYCWGSNGSGQLGDGTNNSRADPELVTSLPNGVTHIAAGYYNTCAVEIDGRLFCWGGNSEGQLGNGTLDPSNVPVEVTLAEPPGETRVWGDVDCDGETSTRDNQALLRKVLQQNPLSQTEPCPEVGLVVELPDSVEKEWGDLDCDGEISTRDNQAELRRVLQQNALSQTEPCPDIGTEVEVVVPQ